MRVIVTRPLREAQRWVAQLRLHGFDALALPLIDIAPAAQMEPLHAAWSELTRYTAVMFVSANAVDHFFRVRTGSWPPIRAWATGPGTRAALLEAGVPADQIDAPPADAVQFDSEALWQVVGAGVAAGQQVLIVRGADAQGHGAGRDWFAAQVEAAGATQHRVLAYRRCCPQWGEAERAMATVVANGPAVWLLSSSEAVGNLRGLMPAQSWAGATAVATHARIAQAARAAGFGVVCESRPELSQVIASIESLQ